MCKRGTDLELALLTIWRYQLSITPPAAANAFITSVINIVLCVPLPPLEAFIALFKSDIMRTSWQFPRTRREPDQSGLLKSRVGNTC
jgi:hypothetical protein